MQSSAPRVGGFSPISTLEVRLVLGERRRAYVSHSSHIQANLNNAAAVSTSTARRSCESGNNARSSVTALA